MKGKKSLIRIGVFLGLLALLFIIARITGVLQFYYAPSGSMEPALKPNSRFAVSNLKKPKRNSIVAFKRVADLNDGVKDPGYKIPFVSRVIAFGGETIQLKNGYAFVNGQPVDDSASIQLPYIMNSKDAAKVVGVLVFDKEAEGIDSPDKFKTLDNGLSSLTLTYKEYRQAKQFGKIYQDTTYDEASDKLLFGNDSTKNWTVDNYGPLLVPEGYYFFLGDNRRFSRDSRYVGPISVKDFVGTLVWK